MTSMDKNEKQTVKGGGVSFVGRVCVRSEDICYVTDAQQPARTVGACCYVSQAGLACG